MEPTQIPANGAFATVVLNDWWPAPDGRKVLTITGKVRIVNGESIGWTSGSRDSATWAAIVEGETQSVVVLGCQIRGANIHSEEVTVSGENWKLS